MFSEHSMFKINDKYQSNFYRSKKIGFVDSAYDKLGKNVISKGLNKLSEIFISKSLLYGLSGTIGSINPLMIIASFAISATLENKDKNKKI